MTVRFFAAAAVIASIASGQVPDLLAYDFNVSVAGPPITITNNAVPGVGLANPTLANDHSITNATLCPAPQDPALTASNAASAGISTGWNCTLGTSSWTVGMKLDLSSGLVGGVPTLNYFQYLFGCSSAAAFRAFVDGVAGNGNVILRGPVADTIIPGGGNQNAPVFICWVYDASAAQIRGYLNGAQVVVTAQGAVNVNGTAPLLVGTNTGGGSSLLPGVKMDDFRFYGRAITPAEILAWNTCSAGTASPTVQVNQANASLALDAATGTVFSVASVQKCPGQLTVLNLGSALPAGTFYDVGINVGPAVNPGATFSGQVVNLDVSVDPIWLSNGLASQPVPLPPLAWPGAPLALPFAAPPIAVTVHTQGYFIDPTSVLGVSLTAPAQLAVVPSIVVTLGDDTTTQINLSQLCPSVPSILFYGTYYPSFFVNSNGSVSFGSGDPSLSSSAAALVAGPPRASAHWADMNPAAGGQVLATGTPAGVSVRWLNVPQFGTTNQNSFTITFDAGNATTFSGYAIAAGFTSPTLVGMSPGSIPVTTQVPVSFSSLVGAGLQVHSVSDTIYEAAGASSVPGLGTTITSIVFPNSDGSGFYVL